MGLIARARYRLAHAWQARRLGALGARSAVMRPEMIGGGEGILVGADVTIRPHARLECVRDGGFRGEIHIGDGTDAQLYLHVGAAERVTIGRKVLIAGRVYISDHDHDWPDPTMLKLVVAPVAIGDGCWLGEGSCVLKGVTLGAGCIVGANAVVTRSFPERCMLVGVPARAIKRFDPAAGAWRGCGPRGEPIDAAGGGRDAGRAGA
ncbi:MAG: hypothetical protein JNM07_11480 [Phycisphaerae bacterium]|nr:hypothetical protein [Phycisphaerae bacterium]